MINLGFFCVGGARVLYDRSGNLSKFPFGGLGKSILHAANAICCYLGFLPLSSSVAAFGEPDWRAFGGRAFSILDSCSEILNARFSMMQVYLSCVAMVLFCICLEARWLCQRVWELQPLVISSRAGSSSEVSSFLKSRPPWLWESNH